MTRRAVTVEQNFPDIDTSELFTGCRWGGMALRLPPTGMATATFELQARDGNLLTGSAAPYFTAPAPQTTTGILAAVNGSIRVFGQERATITGLDFTINLGLSAQPVVGTNFVPDIFYGVTNISGNLSAFFDSPDLALAFQDEAEFEIAGVFEASQGTPKDFMAFIMPRVKMSGQSKTIGADGGVILNFPFQALKKEPTSGEPADATTLTIQSSAAL